MKKIISNKFLHPILFAISPTLSLYIFNLNETFITITLRPILFSIFFVGISWTVLWFLFSRNKTKASIFSSVWIISFFSYGHIYLILTNQKLNEIFSFVGFNTVMLFGIFTTLALILFFLFKTKKNLNGITKILNFTAVVIFAFQLVSIIPTEISRIKANFSINSFIEKSQEELIVANNNQATYPDIYYFVFDRYANANILNKYLSFDNSAFLNSLKNENFFIAENSYANYPATFLSLSSSLNFQHLDSLTDTLGKNYSDQAIIYDKFLSNNRLTDFLISQGYEYTHFGSSWKPTTNNKKAISNINIFKEFNEFELYLYENTILNVIFGKTLGTQVFSGVEALNLKSQNLKFRTDAIKNFSYSNSPQFVFGHFLLPHRPYLFSPDCEPLPFETVRQTIAEKGYLDQLQCANKTITEIIKHVKQSGRPSVIVIQSDEGAFVPTKYFDGDKFPTDNPEDAYKIHGYILNTIYMPDKNNHELPANYASLGLTNQSTPVNTFRIILNYYFGTQLELLEDKSFVFLDNRHPYDFTEITNILKK